MHIFMYIHVLIRVYTCMYMYIRVQLYIFFAFPENDKNNEIFVLNIIAYS